jgi:hypothetical protein
MLRRAGMKTNLSYYLVGTLAVTALIFCISRRTEAEEQVKKLSPEETQSYTNHPYKVIVTGKVVEVFETDKATHLNFGKPRPDHIFTVLINASKAPSFPGLNTMKGKTIEATGSIYVSYEGKPIMYMSDPKDLKVVPEKK